MVLDGIKVSIVVPAYNAEKTVGLTVSAALSQGCPSCGVIVVDDGSTDRTAETVRRYPVKYIRQENAGPASARNTGWRSSDADIVIFTDSDCIPEVGWARKLLDGFKDDGIGAVTGSYDIANPDRLLPRVIHEEIKFRHTGYGEVVKFFGSYNVAIRRKALVETGGFDETYRKASGEDNDLSYRVQKQGYKIAFAPGALVAHLHTASLRKYLKEQYTHGYWRMKLYRAHPDMAGGDDYTRLKDVVEPPLAVLNIGLLILLGLYGLYSFAGPAPYMQALLGASLLAVNVLFWIQAPAALKIAGRLRDPGYLFLAPVTFLRGYARGLGMLSGFMRFFVRGER